MDDNREQGYYYGNNDPFSADGSAPDRAMTDKNGRPLKNRYGMKLAFSILEIVSCCLFNPITMILGIVSIVFTCGADASYRRQQKEEFLRKARTATITLMIGLVLDIVVVILWVMLLSTAANRLMGLAGADSMGELYGDLETFADWIENGGSEEEFWSMLYDAYSDGDYEDYFGDESYYADGYEYNYADPEAMGEYWKFTMNGIALELPEELSNVLETGFVTDIADPSSYTLEAEELMYLMLLDAGGNGDECFGYLEVYNPYTEATAIEDCMVVYVELYDPEVYSTSDVTLDVTMDCGIGFGSTADEVLDALGEPSYSDEDDDIYYMQWDLEEDEYNDFVLIQLTDGIVSDIAIGYAGDYEIIEE